LKRINIILIIIILVLVVGAAIGVTLYEQNLLKQRMVEANAIHTQIMNDNNNLENNTDLKIAYAQDQKMINDLQRELKVLRTVSDTIFAAQVQKDYINAAIEVNTDNKKMAEMQMKGIDYVNKGQLSNALQIQSELKTQSDEVQKAANKRDTIMAAHPEEFGFEVTKL